MGQTNRLVVAIALAALLGIGLRVAQYVADTSLWLDEIGLVRGILDADLVALLTQPLPFDQVAPKGFLLIQKLSVLAFGSSDYVLRLLPFLCSIVGLGAFWRLSTLILPGTGALVAMLLFATATPLVAFSGQVKQYSTDVCVALLLTLLAHRLISQKATTRATWLAAAGGAALLWLSQPAVIVAAGLAVPIAFWTRADAPGARLRSVATVTGAWGLSAILVTGVGFASISPSTRDYMRVFWADGFPPDSLAEAVKARWAWNNIRLLFGSAPAGLAYPWPAFYATLAATGLAVLWIQQRRVAVLLLGPMLAALVAAVARQYPFSDRLIVFLTPSMILAIGACIAAGHRLVGRHSKPVAALIALGLTAPALYPVVSTPPPYRIEHAKPVLAHLQVNREATDAIYVYYGAAPVVSMYGAAFGLSRAQYAVGGCHRGESRRYLEELDNFRGHARVWLVLTHSWIYREREDILAYLDAIGTEKDRVIVASRVVGRPQTAAEVYLYDLSAASKLASAKASTFGLTGPPSVNSQGDCVNGPQVMIPSDFECTGPPDTRCARRPPTSDRPAAGER